MMNQNDIASNKPVITDMTKKLALTKANKDQHNIAEHFTQFLYPHIALNQTLKDEAFKIRHNVYCEELAFEEVRKNGQETDEFDDQSIFSLIQHKPSGQFTSCVRLVTSGSDDELLPIEKYCLNSITNQALAPDNFNRAEIGEISRLAVKYDFRRRKVDKFKGAGTGVISETVYSETELRCFPFIAIGLYMSAAVMSVKHGIQHVYVMMEPKLARSMKFIGINFQQLGPAVDYHGSRAPYYINPDVFYNDLSPDFKNLYQSIEQKVSLQLNSTD